VPGKRRSLSAVDSVTDVLSTKCNEGGNVSHIRGSATANDLAPSQV